MKKIFTFLFLGLIFALTADAYATGAAVASLSTEHFQFPEMSTAEGFALSGIFAVRIADVTVGSWGVAFRDVLNGKFLSVSPSGFKAWVNKEDFSKDCFFNGQNPTAVCEQAAATGFLHPGGHYELLPVYVQGLIPTDPLEDETEETTAAAPPVTHAETFTVLQQPTPEGVETMQAAIPPVAE